MVVQLAFISACFDLILGGGGRREGAQAGGGKSQCAPLSVCNSEYIINISQYYYTCWSIRVCYIQWEEVKNVLV